MQACFLRFLLAGSREDPEALSNLSQSDAAAPDTPRVSERAVVAHNAAEKEVISRRFGSWNVMDALDVEIFTF